MDAHLAALRNHDGSPRFYRPGQHPATRRLRDYLARLEELDGPDIEAAAAYAREQLALFEAGEAEDKQRVLTALVEAEQ